MSSQISFVIQSELYSSNKKILINNKHIKELENNIKKYSRCNSQNEIISNKLGIIELYDTTIVPFDDCLKFEFNINKNIQNINDAEEAIWCIFEPAYSHDGNINFSIENARNRHYYTLKLVDVPKHIEIKNT